MVWRRVIGHSGQIVVSRTQGISEVARGYMWLEADAPSDEAVRDSCQWGSVHGAMVKGLAVAAVWPPQSFGRVERALLPSNGYPLDQHLADMHHMIPRMREDAADAAGAPRSE